MDATVNRLLSETKQLIQELEDVKFLDDLIDILNQDIGPVIHKEWKYTKYKCEGPIEEGVIVTWFKFNILYAKNTSWNKNFYTYYLAPFQKKIDMF